MGKIYGYIHARFYEQDVDTQFIILREMQVPKKDIYIDTSREDSSVNPEYQKLLNRLKADDLLYIKSLDALGIDYEEIGKQWRTLTKEKKIDVIVLDMPQLDTRRGKTQFGTLVADLVLSMLEYAPTAKWAARKQKQQEGIAKARQRGVQFGRPGLPLPDNFEQVYQMWLHKEINGQKAAELCNMSKAMFYRRTRQRKEPHGAGRLV